MLTVMDNSTHEENLSQLLQTNIKQIKRAVSFLTGYKRTFKAKNRKGFLQYRLVQMVSSKYRFHQVLTNLIP